MATNTSTPYLTNRFQATFAATSGNNSTNQVAISRCGFQQVSGLSVSVGTTDYREGHELTTNVHKIPGLTKVGNVTFKWGLVNSTEDAAIFDWLRGVATIQETGPSGMFLMDITIQMMTQTGTTQGGPTWQLFRCFPVSFSVPDLNATSDGVAINSLEVAVGGFTFTPPTSPFASAATQASGQDSWSPVV